MLLEDIPVWLTAISDMPKDCRRYGMGYRITAAVNHVYTVTVDSPNVYLAQSKAQSNPGKAFGMFREARDLYIMIGCTNNAKYCSDMMDIALQKSNGKSL